MSSQFEEKLMAENSAVRERNAELRQQNSELRQRNAELQKALKPFASRSLPEDNENWDGQPDHRTVNWRANEHGA